LKSDLKSAKSFEKMSKRVKTSGSKILMTAGIPMIAFIVGGSLALSNFMQTHYELKDKAKKSTTQRKFDLEEEHSKMMKQLKVENFSLSRIPRPEELDAAAVVRKEARDKKKWAPRVKAAERIEKPKIDTKGEPTEEAIREAQSKRGLLW
jgi:Cytochrome c oxidase assembly protein COX16